MISLRGYARPGGRWGARNHILVLPSVVCANLVAERVAEHGAVSVVHQHGCGQVGDDVEHTERAFLGFSTNANVGGVVVVSLGCETIQGRRLANRIGERGQRVEFVGIQASGGTVSTVERGREAVARLRGMLAQDTAAPAPAAGFILGIDAGPGQVFRAAVDALAARAIEAGSRVVLAIPDSRKAWDTGIWAGAPGIAYAAPVPSTGVAIMEHAGEGAEQHVGLAGGGAQVIVSLRGPGQAPVGLAICPVVAVAGDPGMYAALMDDFDLEASGEPGALADRIRSRAWTVFNGEASASELRRIARTM
jgi:altronate dehydratase large subunit